VQHVTSRNVSIVLRQLPVEFSVALVEWFAGLVVPSRVNLGQNLIPAVRCYALVANCRQTSESVAAQPSWPWVGSSVYHHFSWM